MTMTKAEIVERAKFQPTDVTDTEIGKVVWTCHGDRASFRSTEYTNNVVNRVEMRIRVEFKLVDGAWSRQYLSASRVGSHEDVSWAAREKIERVLLAESAKLFTPVVVAHAKAASKWGDAQRKVGEIAECRAKLEKLEKEHEALMAEWSNAVDAFDEESIADSMAEMRNVPVLIGLRAQGHVPTIERMLAEGKSWKEIGDAIGWCGETAQRHYGWHLEAKAKEKK